MDLEGTSEYFAACLIPSDGHAGREGSVVAVWLMLSSVSKGGEQLCARSRAARRHSPACTVAFKLLLVNTLSGTHLHVGREQRTPKETIYPRERRPHPLLPRLVGLNGQNVSRQDAHERYTRNRAADSCTACAFSDRDSSSFERFLTSSTKTRS